MTDWADETADRIARTIGNLRADSPAARRVIAAYLRVAEAQGARDALRPKPGESTTVATLRTHLLRLNQKDRKTHA